MKTSTMEPTLTLSFPILTMSASKLYVLICLQILCCEPTRVPLSKAWTATEVFLLR